MRRWAMAAIVSLALAACGGKGAGGALSAAEGVGKHVMAASSGVTTVSFVAHMDDDLLFMMPDIATDIKNGDNVWVVYLTAGDNGDINLPSMTYVNDRINGVRAAYATAANQPNNWTYSPLQIGNYTIATNTLNGSNVHLAWLYIHSAATNPDKTPDYCGDLYKMLHNSAFSAAPVPGGNAYTLSTIVSTLNTLLTSLQPSVVRTEDVMGYNQGVGDHIDHTSAAIIAAGADSSGKNSDGTYSTMFPRLEYMGYEDSLVFPQAYNGGVSVPADAGLSPNLTYTQAKLKTQIWDQYWPLDPDKGLGGGTYPSPPPNPDVVKDGSIPWWNIMGGQYAVYHASGTPWASPTGAGPTGFPQSGFANLPQNGSGTACLYPGSLAL